MDAFSGKVVRKDLPFLVSGGKPVPTYVMEFLLAQYCATDDLKEIEYGVEKVREIIQKNYIRGNESEAIKAQIKEAGSFKIIDNVTVVLNEREDEFQANFSHLQIKNIPIGSDIVNANKKLLTGNGVWCIVTIGYMPGKDVNVRYEIQQIKPIQVSNINVDYFISQRSNFTTDEWIDFLVHTVGLNPDELNHREKLLTIARLLPHVENNFNYMELGPKGTGKSYVFQDFSPYGVLVSGGDVTSARLFVKMQGNREILGLVANWDVVAWDEFEHQKGRATDAMLIDTMQNYLANQKFNRGAGTHEACASMVFIGNTKHTVPYMLKNSHLFDSIPQSFIKGAFLDRIHFFSPGWEIKMLKKASFSADFGMITDYIAAVLHEFRNLDWTSNIAKYAKFSDSLSQRDMFAIKKTFSGMCKLLYPDGNMTDEEAYELVDFAAEGRRRVKDELYKIDETFNAEKAYFEYTNLQSGEKKVVDTLEHMENSVVVETSELCDAKPETKPAQDSNRKNEDARPVAKVIEIKENQSGVSYKKLFGPYVKAAKVINVTDPFVRLPYQITNFVDFVQMLRDVCDAPEDMKIHLSTSVELSERPERTAIFDDLKCELSSFGMEFTYDFEADHDRFITTDSGWHISLGRGLDIFEPFQKFSLGASSQENRRCKQFTVSYVRNEVRNFGSAERDSSENNSLYLTIKQEYFDQIMAGTKKIEYREVTPNTYQKYLKCFQNGEVMLNEDVIENKDFDRGWSLNLYNNGVCPFFPKEIASLKLLAGRQCPEADRAVVEVTDITLSPTDIENEICTWVVEFHLGEARRVEQF